MEVDGGVAARQEGQHQADFGASASFFLSVFPFFFRRAAFDGWLFITTRPRTPCSRPKCLLLQFESNPAIRSLTISGNLVG